MSVESAKSALDDFVTAFSDENTASKDYLAQQSSPVSTAAAKSGGVLGNSAFDEELLFAGISDPGVIALLKSDLKAIGSDLVSQVVQENVGNKLGRLFEEARSATFNLFGVGPDFFYDMMSRQSKTFKKAILDCAAAGVLLQAAAVAYNTLHQTMNRTDLDNLNPAQAEIVKQSALDALAYMTATKASAERTGNIEGPLGVIYTPQRQVTTPNGNILTDALAGFIGAEVKPGDTLTFITSSQQLQRPGSFPSALNTGTFTVSTVISETQITISPPMVAEVNVEYKIQSVGSATVGAMRAMDGICAFFTNPSAIIALLSMQKLLALIDDFDRSLNIVINLKDQFGNAVSNVINGNFVNPITRTISTVQAVLKDSHEQLKILSSLPSFDKFSTLNLIQKLCSKAGVLKKALTMTPQTNKVAIQASPNYTPVNTATTNIATMTNGPANDYFSFSPKYRQTVQAIMVQDVRPQLAARTTDLLAKILAVQGWLTAQGAILVAVPVVTDALADAARDVLGVSALDKSSGKVAVNDLHGFAMASSNAASKAGYAAEQIATVLKDLPISDSNKFGALSDSRNAILGIEGAQLYSSRSIQEETPEAFDSVDTLSLQVSQINEKAKAILESLS